MQFKAVAKAHMVHTTADMGRRRSFYLPRVVFEVTLRTVQGRFLLAPSPKSRDLILGVLGRALELYPSVELHGFVFLSNHGHILLSAFDEAQISAFICHIKNNIAREMARLHKWSGTFWKRAGKPAPVIDEGAMIQRLTYVLSQSVKEGLVDRPEQWPGASSVPWLFGRELFGTWIFRQYETRARRKRNRTDPSHYTRCYQVPITPLPCWSGLSRKRVKRIGRSLIEKVVKQARAIRTRPPMGAIAAMKVNPYQPHEEPKSGTSPLCHASSARVREAFKTAFREFVRAFRSASAAMNHGLSASRELFPVGSFPRPNWFVPAPVGYVPPWTTM